MNIWFDAMWVLGNNNIVSVILNTKKFKKIKFKKKTYNIINYVYE